jgi:uncharacterized protein (DUF302 family)
VNNPTTEQLGIHVALQIPYEEAIQKVTAALKVEGFGILTEIDVKETMKKKLDVDFRPYKILGACNPPLAHRALCAAPEVGLLLPCNVTVMQNDDGSVLVSLLDPMIMVAVLSNSELKAVAVEAQARLNRVALALQAA